MSSITSTAATARQHPPTFTSALRGESMLTRRRIVVWVSLGIWAACIAVFAYAVTFLSTVGAEWYSPEQQDMILTAMLPQGTSYYVLASLPLYGAPQLAILGAILGASDAARGTFATIASRFPNRAPLIAARVVGVIITAGVAALVTVVTSIVSSIAVALIADRAGSLPPVAELATTLLATWLIATTFIALGFAIGTLARSTITAAIIAAAWVLGIESMFVGMLAPVVPLLEQVQGLLPVGATSSLAAAFVPAGRQTVPALTAATTPEGAVLVLVAWTALAITAISLAIRRRDLA